MGSETTDEFREAGVRIALISGLTWCQVADGLGVGLLTLNKWVDAYRDMDAVSSEDRDFRAIGQNENRRCAQRNEQAT